MNGLAGPGEVDLTPFREAYARSGMRICEVARAGGMEWTHVKRLLTPTAVTCRKAGKTYGPYPYRACSYETALRLARAMGVDPFEVGL